LNSCIRLPPQVALAAEPSALGRQRPGYPPGEHRDKSRQRGIRNRTVVNANLTREFPGTALVYGSFTEGFDTADRDRQDPDTRRQSSVICRTL